MDDTLNSEFFNTLDRVTTSTTSFSGMLEYFQAQKPEQWKPFVESLMKISKRDYSNVGVLGLMLEEMIDDYASYMASATET
jgi:hypothetical protein